MNLRKARQEDREEIIRLSMEALPNYYEGHNANFGDSLLKSHLESTPSGMFSVKKTLFVTEVEDELTGLACAIEKKGGLSVKISPLLVSPKHKGCGTGKKLYGAVEKMARAKGFGKIYTTLNENNVESRGFFESRGFLIEAKLDEQYKEGDVEFAYGKFLDDPLPEEKKVFVEQVAYKGPYCTCDYTELLIGDKYEFNETFCFEETNRNTFVAKDLEGNLSGMTSIALKRGGTAKMFPLYAENVSSADQLIKSGLKIAEENGARKLFTNVSVLSSENYTTRLCISALYKNGFSCEGMIKEPYFKGVDEIAFGKRIL